MKNVKTGSFKQLNFIRKYLLPYKVKVIICFILMILLSMISLPLPALNGRCIDLLTLKDDKKLFICILFLIAFFNIIRYFISVNVKLLLGKIGNNVVSDIKRELIYKYLCAPMEYIDETNKGYYFSRINECENIRRLFSSSLVTVLLGVIDLLFSLVIIFFVNLKLSLVTLVFLPILYIVIHNTSEKMKRIAGVVAEQTAKTASTVMNVLDNTKFIKILDLYKEENGKVKNEFLELLFKQDEQIKQNSIYTESIQLMNGIHNLLILAIAGYMIYSGEITIGLYITYIGYSGKVFANILSFSSFGVLINPILVSIQRIKEIQQIDTEENGNELVKENINEIDMSDVTFRYHNNIQPVLKNWNCKFTKGKLTIINGKNGSGKTTLISLLLGLYKVENGKICFGGQNIKFLDKCSLRSSISYMSQEPGIFEGNLKENLIKGNRSIIDVEKELKDLKLYDLLVAFKYNLNYQILHNGSNLSGGQKQLISFLRSVLQNRPIIILDEPTNSMDDNSKEILIKFIEKNYYTKKIVIIITHDFALQQQLMSDNTQIIEI